MKDDELVHQVKGLDSDMQMLVYENYNKFISATDTIRKMKGDVETMETEMDQLVSKMCLFALVLALVLARKESISNSTNVRIHIQIQDNIPARSFYHTIFSGYLPIIFHLTALPYSFYLLPRVFGNPTTITPHPPGLSHGQNRRQEQRGQQLVSGQALRDRQVGASATAPAAPRVRGGVAGEAGSGGGGGGFCLSGGLLIGVCVVWLVYSLFACTRTHTKLLCLSLIFLYFSLKVISVSPVPFVVYFSLLLALHFTGKVPLVLSPRAGQVLSRAFLQAHCSSCQCYH